MKIYSFTIYGNQENRIGNPIPYHRATQGSFWNKGSKRYNGWKQYVQKAFFDEMKKQISSKEYNLLELTAFRQKKPIGLDIEKCEMNIYIYWRNEAHADADNIFKGIADALFVNDKNLYKGSFMSSVAEDKKGYVVVDIKISDRK